MALEAHAFAPAPRDHGSSPREGCDATAWRGGPAV